MAEKQLKSAKIIKKTKLTDNVISIHFSSDNFSFVPGQFVTFRFGPTDFRSFSICSDFRQQGQFEIIVAVGHEGLASNFFKNSEIGDNLQFTGPSGKFLLEEKDIKEGKDLIFVATGTGVSPFIPYLTQLEEIGYSKKVSMYWGVKKERDIFYREKLERFKNTIQNFNYTICVSQPELDELENEYHGRVTDLCHPDMLKDGTISCYLCGNPHMIEDILSKMKEHGVPEDSIHYEKFTWAVQKTLQK